MQSVETRSTPSIVPPAGPIPPPVPMRKSCSLNNLNNPALNNPALTYNDGELNELVKLIIPILKKANVFHIKSNADTKSQSNQKAESKQLKELQKSNDRLVKMNKGLKEQVACWMNKTKEMQITINNLETKVRSIENQHKSEINKLNEFAKAHNKAKKVLKEIDEKNNISMKGVSDGMIVFFTLL